MTPSQGTKHKDLAMKAGNIETISNAMVKNTISEPVEPKQIKILIQKLR